MPQEINRYSTPFTVKELIAELQKVKDQSGPVLIRQSWYTYDGESSNSGLEEKLILKIEDLNGKVWIHIEDAS